MILSISGRIGVGKDTVGKIIQYIVWAESCNSSDLPSFEEWIDVGCPQNKNGFEIKKFAQKLKQITAILTGCDVNDLERQAFKNNAIGTEWVNPQGDMYTYRTFLQRLGTEAIRDVMGTDVWVNALMTDYRLRYIETDMYKVGHLPRWILTDTRFPNELKAVKDNDGITIRVERENDLENLLYTHPSETALDDAEFDYTIDNNGTISQLIEKVEEILRKEEII